MMWLEIAIGVSPIVCAWGVSVIFLKRNPDISDRLGRFIRSEVESWLPRKRKRPTIEIAVLTGEDVSLKWWDEEFAKLDRTTVSSSWNDWANHMSNLTIAAMPKELNGMARGGIKSYTDGDVTYSLAVDLAKAHQEMADEIVKMGAKLARSNATPPGMKLSLREAEDAGVSLEVARKQALAAAQRDGRVGNIPQDISVRLRHKLDGASSWDELIDAMNWCNLMIEKYVDAPEARCEFCDYAEQQTYADKRVKRYKTAECWECGMRRMEECRTKSWYALVG